MSGVPELNVSDPKPAISMKQLMEDAQQEMSHDDKGLLEKFFFMEQDCRNLVRLLKDPDAELLPGGFFTMEQYQDLITSAREMNFNVHRYPTFMSEFAREWDYNRNIEGYFPEDEIIYQYYLYGSTRCRNKFVSEWWKLNLDINNILTAMLAREQGWNIGDFIKGDGEVQEMIRENKTRDFDLTCQFDYVKELMKIVDEQDPVQKEKMIDAFKWQWLEEKTFFEPFSVEALFAYMCKLQILERWSKLDVEQGKETFEKIIDDLRGEARVPAEYSK